MSCSRSVQPSNTVVVVVVVVVLVVVVVVVDSWRKTVIEIDFFTPSRRVLYRHGPN